MKNKFKIMSVLLFVALIFSLGNNLYQKIRINKYKENLSYSIRNNIQVFMKYGDNIDNEDIYAERYGSIVAAHEAFATLSENKGISDWESSLPGLFMEIKRVMVNDKDKFKEVFDRYDVGTLMFKISDNIEDHESINKVYKQLNE